MKCPVHIKNNVRELTFDEKRIFRYYRANDTYIVTCRCGNEWLRVFTNELPHVEAQCDKCKSKMVIYDLREYPAATVLPDNEELTVYVSEKNDELFKLCVDFEYPEAEADIELDVNDITWCIVLGLGQLSNTVFEIVNDETA